MIDFVVWPESSEYQDGFDITETDLNILTQEPFGVHTVEIIGELGAYCDDDQMLDINSEWQITVEYESDISTQTTTLPFANAGSDQSVEPGDLVTLDGSASFDSDGDIVSYLWEQSSGIDVTLSTDVEAVVTFTFPEVTETTELVFELSVTDDGGNISSDEVIITAYILNQLTISERRLHTSATQFSSGACARAASPRPSARARARPQRSAGRPPAH